MDSSMYYKDSSLLNIVNNVSSIMILRKGDRVLSSRYKDLILNYSPLLFLCAKNITNKDWILEILS